MQQSIILRAFNALVRYLDKALAIFLGILVGVLTVSVIVTVILRYFLGLSFAWAEELMTMVFIATTFFGAALGLREKEHIAITLGSEGHTLRRKALSVVVMLVVIAISAFVLRYSLIWIERVGKVPSPTTGIQSGFFYMMVPVSFGIIIFYAAVHIVSEFLEIDPPSTKSRFEDEVGISGGDEA